MKMRKYFIVCVYTWIWWDYIRLKTELFVLEFFLKAVVFYLCRQLNFVDMTTYKIFVCNLLFVRGRKQQQQ